MSEQRRGSIKLLEQLGTKPMTISEESLLHLQEAAQSAGGKLLDWHQYGGGVVIDGVYGRIRVDTPQKAAEVVSAFLSQDLRVVTETFPYGTPHVDEWVIAFRVGTQGVR